MPEAVGWYQGKLRALLELEASVINPYPLCSLRGGLSLGLYGFTFWAQDRGGFTGAPTDKLYIRFTKHCILKSHIRYHGGGPRFREPRNYRLET